MKKCAHSISQQSYKPHRIIIIDNNSEDDSVKEVQDILPSAEIHYLETNTGFAVGNNIAVELADDCNWVALLNPDAFPEKDWLKNLHSAVEKFPDYSSFSSLQLFEDDHNMIDGAGDEYFTCGRARRRLYKTYLDSIELSEPRDIFSPCAAAALYNRADFLSVGGFDENFFCYMEDVDLGFRLILNGKKSKFIHDSIVYHKGAATSGGAHSDFAVYHGHRNLVWVYVKNMPSVLFWLYLPEHIILNLVSILSFGFRNQFKTILKAKKDAFIALPAILKARKKVQLEKKVSISNVHKKLEKSRLKLFI